MTSDIPTSELEETPSEEDNPHGFVYGHMLDTYKRNKKEKEAEHRASEKFEHKKRDRKNKNAGTTNTEKKKNKPFNMLLPKRIKEQDEERNELRGRKLKRDPNGIKQLGHFKKNQQQKLDSKKRKAGFRV